MPGSKKAALHDWKSSGDKATLPVLFSILGASSFQVVSASDIWQKHVSNVAGNCAPSTPLENNLFFEAEQSAGLV